MADHFNKGTKYLEKGKYDKAIQCFKKQLDFKEAYLNLGNAYRLVDKDDLAEEAYLKAADRMTPFANNRFGSYDLALSNLGLLSYTRGDDDEAIAYYTGALALNPMHFDAIWNYANASLRKWCNGEEVDLATAWKMYEFRFKRNNPVALDKYLPRWDGISHVSSICVLAEQGMGDKIMFGRYIACLKEYADEIWVQCPEELDCIFSDYKTCRDSSHSSAVVGIPICSLAGRFGMVAGDWLKGKFDAATFDTDYLCPDFNVGIVWSGSSTHANDRNRSIPAWMLADLSDLATLYSLTPGVSVPRGVKVLGSTSWKKTAEAINGLDLVITVDTSVVHVAGSLGKECWMLEPLKETDFRWGKDGTSNVWYDSVKVIRNPGSWEAVMKQVRKDLVAKKAEVKQAKLEKLVAQIEKEENAQSN